MSYISSTIIGNPNHQVLRLFEIEEKSMSKRILIVEDHDDGRELLKDFLEYSGYTPILAANGDEGERLAKSEIPDLILLDISLPVKSGWDIARALREHDATQEIPIIALTAHVRPEDEEMAKEVGCSSFLPKPVKPKEVLKKIEELLITSPE